VTAAPQRGDLSPTAAYTCATWAWGGLPDADLYHAPEFETVFRAVNAASRLSRALDRRVEPIRESLLQRHAMLDHLVREAGAPQVLELAAGFSRRGATFSADPALVYTELDLPHVIAKKRELLYRTPRGRQVAARANLRMVAADVAVVALDHHLSAPGPATVISEGLIMYLDATLRAELWRRIARALAAAGGGSYAFDFTPWPERPGDRFGQLLHRTMKRFTRGQGFAPDDRTRDQLVADLEAAGFDHARAIDASTVARAWSLPRAETATRQVVFVAQVGATAARR
jgi:O-methyltransferase involved in polyketide biosynthesis